MAGSLAKTKRRIRSIEGTEKTTKAMELIAMVKVRRFAEEHALSSSFSEEYRDLMGVLFAFDKSKTKSHYGKVERPDLPTLYIVMSSNLGLCGAYNNNLFKLADKKIGSDNYVAPIGNKAIHHYAEHPHLIMDYAALGLDLDMGKIQEICRDLKRKYNEGEVGKIVVVYTHYVNSISFVPSTFTLLPVQVSKPKNKEADYCPPLFDEDPRTLIHRFMDDYLAAMFYARLLESELSEQASRRTAMDNANDNADALLEKLRIEYNKARQNAITQEITEVCSGSNN